MRRQPRPTAAEIARVLGEPGQSFVGSALGAAPAGPATGPSHRLDAPKPLEHSLREAVARIIDPDAEGIGYNARARWKAALAKADAILALPEASSQLLKYREALEEIEGLDFGICGSIARSALTPSAVGGGDAPAVSVSPGPQP